MAPSALAGWRLRADPRSAGRVAAVLFVCGLALGIDGRRSPSISARGLSGDAGFYLTGYGMAAVAALVAGGVALLTMVVGAADGLLDARRPLSASRRSASTSPCSCAC